MKKQGNRKEVLEFLATLGYTKQVKHSDTVTELVKG